MLDTDLFGMPPAPARRAGPRGAPRPRRGAGAGGGVQYDLVGTAPLGSDEHPRTELVIVTAEMADAALARSSKALGNSVFRGVARTLARIHREVGLPYTGIPIAESDEAGVLDGLARLLAVRETGRPLLVPWVSGLDRRVVAGMDINRRRRGEPAMLEAAAASTPGGAVDAAAMAAVLLDARALEWHEIDVATAERMLARREAAGLGCSPLRQGDHLLRDLRDGLYLETHHPIVLTFGGVMLDGVRRCRAVAESGRSIRTLVSRVPDGTPETFYRVGRTRNIGHNAQRIGIAEGWDIQSSAKAVLWALRGEASPTQAAAWEVFWGNDGYGPTVWAGRRTQAHLSQSANVAARIVCEELLPGRGAGEFFDAVIPTGAEAADPPRFERRVLDGMGPLRRKGARIVWRAIKGGMTSASVDMRNATIRELVRGFHAAVGEPPPVLGRRRPRAKSPS